MLVYTSELHNDSDDMHDLCIDFNRLPEGQIYYRRQKRMEGLFYFFSDNPITDEVLSKFWQRFYG